MISPVLQLGADNLQISQIDLNRLLFQGSIDIYFTADNTPAIDDLTVKEKSAGELQINSLDTSPNKDAGIDFLLLIDNSGSMYEESYQGSSRIKQAKLALNTFLDRIDNTNDRAAFYAFNTGLQELAPFGADTAEIRRSLSKLEEPAPEMAYTELYNSLVKITSVFPKTYGRRAVIVLSDGENYSVSEHLGTAHPEWGMFAAAPADVESAFQRAGISLDGINISDDRDEALKEICEASGGKFHDVRSTNDISSVYNGIRDKILNEYKITVTAPAFSGGSGLLMLTYAGRTDSREIPVPVLFGSGRDLPLPAILIALLLGLAGTAMLYVLRFEKPVKTALIQSLGSNRKTILKEGATVIGASRDADMTIAGNPGIDAMHATILHDEKTGVYTLISEKTVRVNNRKVKEKRLAPGDVIRIEGSTIIFDEPDGSV